MYLAALPIHTVMCVSDWVDSLYTEKADNMQRKVHFDEFHKHAFAQGITTSTLYDGESDRGGK